jgi:hypothetical protein
MVLEHVLKAAGNGLSRENILRQALSIKDLELPMLLPGIKVNTAESDHLPVGQTATPALHRRRASNCVAGVTIALQQRWERLD